MIVLFLLFSYFQIGKSVFLYDDILKVTREGNSNGSKCYSDLSEVAKGIVSLEPWALKMLDATSKIPSSILNGNIQPLGNYDECLQVHHNEIDGKFCRVDIKIGQTDNGVSIGQSIGPRLYFCIPKSCSINDLIDVLNLSGIFKFSNSCCSTDDPKELDGWAIFGITIFSAIGLVTILSTSYDLFLYRSKKEPISQIAIAFSLYSNGKKLFNFQQNAAQIGCLNGIKLFSMIWVVLGHVYMAYAFVPLDNYLEVQAWIKDASSQYILGATVSVDSFLFVAGFVVIYGFQTTLDKGRKFNVVSFFLHRYLRLTPALAAMILAHATLFDYLGGGPVWENTKVYLSDNCKNYWWSALLFIQNYVNPNELCIPQSWYLSLDFQVFIISPIFMFALRLRPLLGHCLLVVTSLLSMLASFLVGWFYNLNGQMSGNLSTLLDYQSIYYPVPQTRLAPYLIGILLGYWIHKWKKDGKKIRMKSYVELPLWIASFTILLACVYSGHELQVTREPNKIANSLFLALMRPGWTLALGWIVLACTMDRGGIVNDILSWPLVQIFSRMCYSVYLVHYALIFLTNFSTRSAFHFTAYSAFHKFWGDLFFTFILSTIWTLVFESPVVVLENMAARRTPRKRTEGVTNNV